MCLGLYTCNVGGLGPFLWASDRRKCQRATIQKRCKFGNQQAPACSSVSEFRAHISNALSMVRTGTYTSILTDFSDKLNKNKQCLVLGLFRVPDKPSWKFSAKSDSYGVPTASTPLFQQGNPVPNQ
jgi:hypothetical protein